MKTQIPLFRAKKVNSDEYIEGCGIDENFLIEKIKLLKDEKGNPSLEQRYEAVYHQIDISTLSINFPDMIDSEGTRIFASLSEDGKGGDIVNIFGKGLCYLTSDIDGIQAHIINNTTNIFDDVFPFSEALMEKDVGTIDGIQQ